MTHREDIHGSYGCSCRSKGTDTDLFHGIRKGEVKPNQPCPNCAALEKRLAVAEKLLFDIQHDWATGGRPKFPSVSLVKQVHDYFLPATESGEWVVVRRGDLERVLDLTGQFSTDYIKRLQEAALGLEKEGK